MAQRIGLKGSSEITGYKKRLTAPPPERVLPIAKICGVDPGWLTYGPDSDATEPSDFHTWLAAQTDPPPGPRSDPVIAAELFTTLSPETDDDADEEEGEAQPRRRRRR